MSRSGDRDVRDILTAAVSEPQQATGLAQTLLARFGEVGGVELDLPARHQAPRAADIDS